MALFTHWSSKTRRGHIAALSPVAVEPVSTEEAEALFAAWEASTDKSAFITGVSLVQASALCDLIARRVPPTHPEPRPTRANMPQYADSISGRGRRARRARIAILLGCDPRALLVSDVYSVLTSEYGACPAPAHITIEMVAEARRKAGR